MNEENKIDFLSPGVVIALTSAFIGDITFFLIITHYLCGAFVLGFLLPKVKGPVPKAILVVAFIFPLPALTVGALLAIIFSKSKIAEVVVEQVGIQVVAAFTGGAGEALEGATLAGEGAEVAATAAEAGEAAGTVAQVGETAAEAGGVAAEGTEAAASGVESGEAAEGEGRSINEKASEKIEEKAKGKIKEKLQSSGGNDEEDQEGGTDENEDYDELMETEAERPLGEVLEEKYFEYQDPSRQRKAPKVEGIDAGRARVAANKNGETIAQRQLRERLEKMQRQSNSVQVEDEDQDEDQNDLKKVA